MSEPHAIVDPQTNAVVELYPDARKQIAALEEADESLCFDVDTTEGEKEARSHVDKMRTVRGNVERARKKTKKATLEYGRQVDSAAKELDGRVLVMIDRHMAPLTERAKRIKAEEKRVAEQLRGLTEAANPLSVGLPSDQIQGFLDKLQAIVVDKATFGDSHDEAEELKVAGIERLTRQVRERKAYEIEQAELTKLREEKLQRDKEDRERKIAEDAAEKARADAEAKAARKIHAEREAAEAKIDAEKARADQAELDVKTAERRAIEEAEERAKAFVDIVFDGPPGPKEGGRFIEVDDANGESIKLGEWIQRDQGLWALRIKRGEF